MLRREARHPTKEADAGMSAPSGRAPDDSVWEEGTREMSRLRRWATGGFPRAELSTFASALARRTSPTGAAYTAASVVRAVAGGIG